MPRFAALAGAIRYEFAMQVRRPSLWIGTAFFLPLLFIFQQSALDRCYQTIYGCFTLSRTEATAYWSIISNSLVTIAAGLLLADRFPRDRTLRTDEILQTIPGTVKTRVLGKYLGTVLATMLPLFLFFCLGLLLILAKYHDWLVIPSGLASFALINLPAILLVGAFAIACTTFMWPPLFQFLFVGFWFWDSLNPTEAIPTISGTLLSPNGAYALGGIFHARGYQGFVPHPSVGLAVANIAVLMSLSVLALVIARQIQLRREAAQ